VVGWIADIQSNEWDAKRHRQDNLLRTDPSVLRTCNANPNIDNIGLVDNNSQYYSFVKIHLVRSLGQRAIASVPLGPSDQAMRWRILHDDNA
jgi:hypothetical protein